MSTQLDRRRFLSMSFVAAGAALVGGQAWSSVLAQSTVDSAPRWSDPATWGGKVPSPGEWVSLDRPVVLDVDAQVAGLAIQIGGALIFDPDRTCTLTSTANIVVLGLLQMRPSSASVNHLIRFTGIDESKFVGGGHMVLDTDVGLWCLNDGIVDIAGTPRRAWARTTSGVGAGATSITLQVDPTGWRVGDEIAIVPTLGTEHSNHHDAYDYARVTSIAGTVVGISVPTKFAHPAVDVGNGIVVAPEVLNLTRNVNIEGTPNGRAHVIFVHGNKPQQMSYFGARWVGPRQATGELNFTAECARSLRRSLPHGGRGIAWFEHRRWRGSRCWRSCIRCPRESRRLFHLVHQSRHLRRRLLVGRDDRQPDTGAVHQRRRVQDLRRFSGQVRSVVSRISTLGVRPRCRFGKPRT